MDSGSGFLGALPKLQLLEGTCVPQPLKHCLLMFHSRSFLWRITYKLGHAGVSLPRHLCRTTAHVPFSISKQ